MDIKSVIFIRRDNIGDLVCTTPAIRALRLRWPRARIAALVNSYNADVILNNPDVDEVYVYEKWKHSGGKGRTGVWFNNLKEIRRIRAASFDAAIGCSYAWSARLARYTFATGAKERIGISPERGSSICYNRPVAPPASPMHEVEAMMRLVSALGVTGAAPSLVLRPGATDADEASGRLRDAGAREGERLIAFHISSRRSQNKWPRERFRELGDMIQSAFDCRILLLWSPGAGNNPLHPGDDQDAEWLASSMKKKPVSYRTERLGELIAALSLADCVVCCDGGAMHIAAGLGKPILTIWGTTGVRRWSPWGVPHIILKKGGSAAEVNAAEAFEAFNKLREAWGA
ncbi:MAG: glycosyltransferase family 9 protein [Deltaproteobacteria bacterium]|nr:glycosyltransferase family 9 protein [Deltaproteobacteria bacterium]